MAVLVVGMADLKTAKSPDMLTTLGLGSCVGVTIYDRTTRIGGMAHIMLPSSTGFDVQNRAKFADLAIKDLVSKMVREGAMRSALKAKIAGGAHMFGSPSNDVLAVGGRNAAACMETLKALGIPVIANDTGGTYGRTIEFYTETGDLKIKTVGAGVKIV